MSQIHNTAEIGLHANIVHQGRQDKEFAGKPPIMRLFYNYQHPFNTMACAYLKKYNWEDRSTLTTIAKVE